MDKITTELLIETREFWDLPPKTLYHELISIIISQRIRFTHSRSIRKKLYQLIESYEITYPLLQNLSDGKLLEIGLTADKIEIIRHIPEDITIENLANYAGIGEWTINALKLKIDPYLYSDVFLYEDLWIRKHIAGLMYMNQTPSTARSKKIEIPNNRSHISRFLWRLKHEADHKILNNHKLTKEDFI